MPEQEPRRSAVRDAGRVLGQEFLVLVVRAVWWIGCLGLGGFVGTQIGGGTGLLAGLTVGFIVAVVGEVAAVATGLRSARRTMCRR
jgi:hypothetical protein